MGEIKYTISSSPDRIRRHELRLGTIIINAETELLYGAYTDSSEFTSPNNLIGFADSKKNDGLVYILETNHSFEVQNLIIMKAHLQTIIGNYSCAQYFLPRGAFIVYDDSKKKLQQLVQEMKIHKLANYGAQVVITKLQEINYKVGETLWPKHEEIISGSDHHASVDKQTEPPRTIIAETKTIAEKKLEPKISENGSYLLHF